MVVELLCVFAAILKRNPELDFTGELSCDGLIQEAVAVFKKVQSPAKKKLFLVGCATRGQRRDHAT